jgi:hypothetical protein
MKIYSLYCETNHHFSDILTVDSIPEGPLGSLIYLNTIHQDSPSNIKKSMYFVYHPYYPRSVVKVSEIFVIFDYLKANGYKLESDITQYYPPDLLHFFGLRENSFYSFDTEQATNHNTQQKKQNLSLENNKRLICKFSFQPTF